MKKENDDELGFVLRNYREGAFDPESALKKMKNSRSTRRSPTLRRWVAMAASLLCLVAFAAVLFVLTKFGWPAITGMLDERARYIDEGVAKAKEAGREGA